MESFILEKWMDGELTGWDIGLLIVIIVFIDFVKHAVKAAYSEFKKNRLPNTHDEKLWNEIDSILPTEIINFWRNTDAAAKFLQPKIAPIFHFVDHFSTPRPDECFIDKSLEKLKNKFIDATMPFAQTMSRETVPNEHNLCWLTRPDEGISQEEFSSLQKEANEQCDEMIKAYDAFKSEVIRKLLNQKVSNERQ